MDITTERLVLRQLRPEDAEWIAREIANPKVQVWLTSPPHPYRLAHAEAFIARHQDDPLYRVLQIAGQGAGVVSLTEHDDQIYDLGYWLSEAQWGHGYMTEAATGLLDFYVRHHQCDVWSGWIEGNAASRNVLTKLGFEPIGEKRAMCYFRSQEVTVEKVILSVARWRALSTARE